MPHAFHARTLTEADLPSVLALCESNPRYYQHFGEPPHAREPRRLHARAPARLHA